MIHCLLDIVTELGNVKLPSVLYNRTVTLSNAFTIMALLDFVLPCNAPDSQKNPNNTLTITVESVSKLSQKPISMSLVM